jgi:zinc transport system ATP-binding protein
MRNGPKISSQWHKLLQNSTDNPTIIDIKHLSYAIKKEEILKDINLEVKQKDFLVIIGPNGGGKSTLLKLILGIYPSKSGTISIQHTDAINKLDIIGYVPQNTNINLNFPIKVIEVVMMGFASKKSFFGYAKEDLDLANKLLEQVGMKEYAHQKIGELSGGQRQRVMIARALFAHPKILILDEPTSSIDVEGQAKIYDLLQELNKEITIIVVSHDLSVILNYATKVAHINKKLSFHDMSSFESSFDTQKEHICEVELLEMLGKIK